MEIKRISVIGLGKLGSPMAAVFAYKGYSVIGVDLNKNFVDKINQGLAPVEETDLQKFISANKKRISATQNYEEAILNSEATFIIVPTPSEKNGGFSNKYVIEAGKSIGNALKKKRDYHLIVLTSTVIPGSTENELLPVLEKYSSKKGGKDFGLCYNPEFIALGSVIRDLLNPDFVLIGELDSKSGSLLESFYKNVCDNNPPIKRMNIINAEIAKISLNAYVTMKISYANFLAELCENIPGADVDIITDAIGCDQRIGHKYLKGGLGYGGPCFPRDSRAFIYTAKKFGLTPSPLAKATDQINEKQVSRLKKLILSYLPSKGKVGVLGLSYKPNTNVIEESQSLEIAQVLSESVPVFVYDPKAMKNAKELLKDNVIYTSSLKECVQKSDVIVITTPWKEFKKIKPDWLKQKKGRKVVIDCWRILDPKKFNKINNFKYLALGRYYIIIKDKKL